MSGENEAQFVDTNVLVYAYDRSAANKHNRARQILADLWQNENGHLSIQVLQEFYVTVTGKIQRPLTADSAAQIVADLGVWQVHSPRVGDVQTGIRLQSRYQISFWDAMIITSAQQLGCRTLWSEDLNDGQAYGDVVVKNPFL